MARRPKKQVVLSILPGAEPWVLVRHAGGYFKLPGTCSALELVTGALEGWRWREQLMADSELWVRVPLADAQLLAAIKRGRERGNVPR